ncbi:porphobilinogen synthase [Haloglycomyces albus]|uniref:porphobilinogen synthase n=1 Tax=Haloglycomyces albus TaxID=526067 RepID=UPI00046D818F|nr:porphobilinogen synthase [Haloglycomyces albus]
MSQFPSQRPRRMRRSRGLRNLVAETRVHPNDLILPVFVNENLNERRALSSLPGVYQETLESVTDVAAACLDAELGGIMPFAIPTERDATGSAAVDPNGILARTTTAIKDKVGDDLVVIPDLCLDEFTDHGHCGVLDDRGNVANDATLELYGEMARVLAASGADLLGASGMMDGQVGHVRSVLDADGHSDTGILAYAAKFASAFYGPFREAVDSQLQGDRRTYQEDPSNATEALREIDADVEQGADIVMVKPGMPYLDIVAAAARRVTVPVAGYQVSGEYAQIKAAAERGWIDGQAAMSEAVLSLKRAGASMIATYGALDVARHLR